MNLNRQCLKLTTKKNRPTGSGDETNLNNSVKCNKIRGIESVSKAKEKSI